jgi:hypothetical protein
MMKFNVQFILLCITPLGVTQAHAELRVAPVPPNNMTIQEYCDINKSCTVDSIPKWVNSCQKSTPINPRWHELCAELSAADIQTLAPGLPIPSGLVIYDMGSQSVKFASEWAKAEYATVLSNMQIIVDDDTGYMAQGVLRGTAPNIKTTVTIAIGNQSGNANTRMNVHWSTAAAQ